MAQTAARRHRLPGGELAVIGQDIPIEDLVIDEVPMRVARPGGPAETGVIVLHQGPGYASQTALWLRQLAADGHLAIAPLLLHHRGEEAVDPFTRFGGDLAAFAAYLPGDDEIRADFTAALHLLNNEDIPVERSAVVGFSYGGRAAFLAATEHPVSCAITFYGNGIQYDGYQGNEGIPPLADRAPDLQAPWLGLYGEQDFLLAPGEIDDLEVTIGKAPVATELVRYPAAGHAFDTDMVFGPGAPSSLNQDAAADATERTRTFLSTYLGRDRTVTPTETHPAGGDRP
ncbi:dienelactone hydrolase family protein (plasmid) [Rhodococcus qingshengii]|uniref:dienelactone hydrolase family protein n=1 Tax=Rhodococcus qingshengii TaxID=334542 RepID=UPI0021FC9347|nr:dienelactone hydrolase family protein [Rhodococcus qingshengii]BDQ23826.1 dienelactone hydrolase family protein [Rhodococcus qingshengii]